jgi:alpha-L-fucosidase
VLPIVEKYQPGCLFYWNAQRSDARWGGSEAGTVGDPCWSAFPYPSMLTNRYPAIARNNYELAKHGDPEGKYWLPAMADAPLRGYNGRHEWFWEPGDEAHIYPVKDLVKMYYHSVGRNATLLLGVTPDTSGLVPAADAERLRAFGEEIKRRLATPLKTSRTLTLSFSSPQRINQVSISEDIAQGERIRAFSLQAKINGRWKEVRTGASVGNRRILTFQPLHTKALRLHVQKSNGLPQIRAFSAYYITGEPVDN